MPPKPASRRPNEHRATTSNPAATAEQPGWWRCVVTANVLSLLMVAVVMRFISLGNTPGINGDEAWMGVQATKMLHGSDFSGRTPTGNPLNLLLFVPELAMHALVTPSATALRLPAAMSGILALLANFFLGRIVFGRTTAWISTVLLAVLPVNIAYSRFAWDSCQTLLATSCTILPALLAVRVPKQKMQWLLIAGLAQMVSILVHPTNIFVLPLVATAFGFSCRAELCDRWTNRLDAWRRAALLATVAALAVGGAWLVATTRPASVGIARRLEIVRANCRSLESTTKFVKYFSRLFSGVTVYQYIAGSCPDDYSLAMVADDSAPGAGLAPAPRPDLASCRAHDLATFAVFIGAAFAFVGRLRRERSVLDICLLAGWLLTLVGFFLVTEPERGIMPHFERYAICLVAPTSLLLSRAAEWIVAGRATRAGTASLLAIAWICLGSFHWHYFRFISQTGGESHIAFRTARVEPKVAALQQIQARHAPGQPVWVVAQEWWSWMPLQYLASELADVRVVRLDDLALDHQSQAMAAIAEGRLYAVEFPRTPGAQQVRRWLRLHADAPIHEELITDERGRPILELLHVERGSAMPTAPRSSRPLHAPSGEASAEPPVSHTRRLSQHGQ